MRQAVAAMLLVGGVVCSALADRVTLKDGRILEGKVTQSEGKVFIELPYGVVSYPASDVVSIERMPTPTEVVQWRLAQIDRSDADALVEVAEWARDNDLLQRADELLQEALQLNADHARARKLLGYVRADGAWLTVPKALALADSKLAAGKYELLLERLLPAIGEVADSPAHRRRVQELEAHCRLRSKQFDQAAEAFERLAERAPLPESIRYGAIAQILREHPFGVYLVTEAHQIALAGHGAPPLENGPASLADERVLASALRDRAKAAIGEGKALMAEAKKLEETEAEAAESKYAAAARRFTEADVVVPRIAHSWRVAIARRRIGMVHRSKQRQAQVFDRLKDELGKLSPVEFKDHVQRMLRALHHMRSDLEAILKIAEPFENELILDVIRARKDLEAVQDLIEVLKKERDAIRRDAGR